MVMICAAQVRMQTVGRKCEGKSLKEPALTGIVYWERSVGSMGHGNVGLKECQTRLGSGSGPYNRQKEGPMRASSKG